MAIGTFPYDKEFLPIAKFDDFVSFYGRGNKPSETYQIKGVEVLQPFMIDFLQISGALPTSVTTLAANGSTNDRTGFVPEGTMRNIFQVDSNMFGQWRIQMLDDILLALASPGQANAMFSTVVANTYIQRPLPQHKAKVQLSGGLATDTLIWANSSNVDIAGGIAGQTPTRHSKVIGLMILTTAATTVYFADGNVAGGTLASSANFAFGVVFATADWIFLGPSDLPANLELTSGLVCEQSGSATVTITAVVQEDNIGAFSGQLTYQPNVVNTQNDEFFVLENEVPAMKAINPTSVVQASARMMVAGYQFIIKQIQAPAGVRPIQIPVAALRHAGSVGSSAGSTA